jgi:hypothetical protein
MLTVSLECPNSIAPLAFSDVYFSSTDLHNITAIVESGGKDPKPFNPFAHYFYIFIIVTY